MQSLLSTGKRRGFSISVDALLATMVAVGVIVFIFSGSGEGDKSSELPLLQKQAVDDVFLALHNSGLIADRLSNSELSILALKSQNPERPGIYDAAKSLLPEDAELQIAVKEYRVLNLPGCKEFYKQGEEDVFSECFGQEPVAVVEWPELPNSFVLDKASASGQLIEVLSQPISENIAENMCVLEQEWQFKGREEKRLETLLQGEEEPEVNVETYVMARDGLGAELNATNPLLCHDSGTEANETAHLLLKARNKTRNPVAIAMVMDESKSMETMDITSQESNGSFNEGTCLSEPKWVEGKFGQALRFNGLSNYVLVPHHNSLDTSNEITISAWVKAESFKEGWQGIALKRTQGTYEMWIYGDKPKFGLKVNGTLHRPSCTKPECSLSTGVWHHLLYTFDGTNMRIFLDDMGAEKDSWGYPGAITDTTAHQDFWVGYSGHAEEYFNGIIDDVRVYSKALNESERNLVHTGASTATDYLMGHWKFNEGSGNSAGDSSVNENHGQLWHWANVGGKVGEEGPCTYVEGEPGTEPTTNCPESKAEHEKFTGKIWPASYDIGAVYDDIMAENSSVDFIADSQPYNGVCTKPGSYLRLFTEYSEGIDASTEGNWEDMPFPQDEIVSIGLWSDSVLDTNVYARQRIYPNERPMFRQAGSLSGQGKHEGVYAPPEQHCYNFENWENLGSFEVDSAYDTIYAMDWTLSYSDYESLGGQCSAPRFQISLVEELGNETWVEGKPGFGNALNFDGTIKIASAGETEESDFGFEDRTGSVSLWFKTNNKGKQTIASRWGRDPYTGWSIYSSGDCVYFSVATRNPNADNYAYKCGNVTDGQWHHVVGAWEEAELTLYFDSSLEGSAAIQPGSTYDEGNMPLWIGRNNYSPDSEISRQFFRGQLDDLRVYGKAVEQGEVNQLFAGGNLLDGLAGHWKFNEEEGNVAADSSGNKNHIRLNAWPADFESIEPCGNGSSQKSCLIRLTEGIKHFDRLYLPTGTYEIWGWSDVPIASVEAKATRTYRHLGVILEQETIGGGTCENEICETRTNPATSPETNCPTKTGYKMKSLPGIGSSWQELDSFEVFSDTRGLKAEASFDYTSYEDAECEGSVLGFINPIDGDEDPNWFSWFPRKGAEITQNFWVNGEPVSQNWGWEKEPPIPEGEYKIIGWAEDSVNYSIRWYQQRVDVAKNAAKRFIENGSWASQDTMSVFAFSDGVRELHPLASVKQNLDELKDSLNGLEPSGETAIADAIDAAAQSILEADEEAGKFIILLTDGKANVCRNSVPCSEELAAKDVASAISDAEAAGITVYIIHFTGEGAGTEEELEDIYDDIAEDIARAMGSVDISFPVTEGMKLGNYGEATCGIWDNELNGGNGGFVPESTEGCEGECSSGLENCYGGETLFYRNKSISEGFTGPKWWAASFTAEMPCNSANCYQDIVVFPHPETSILEVETGEELEWDNVEEETIFCSPEGHIKCHSVIPFKYSDLNFLLTSGEIMEGEAGIVASFEIDNNGHKNIFLPQGVDGIQIAFYKNSFENKLSASKTGGFEALLGCGEGETVDIASSTKIGPDGNLQVWLTEPHASICSRKEGKCVQPQYEGSHWKLQVNNLELGACPENDCSGTIIAKINGNKEIAECSLNNMAEMYCLTASELRFFTIEYRIWRGQHAWNE